MLTLPPHYTVEEVDSGCCGMAGTFGYEAEHYHISRQMAERRLLPAVRAAAADTIIVAAGLSCRQQIGHGENGRSAPASGGGAAGCAGEIGEMKQLFLKTGYVTLLLNIISQIRYLEAHLWLNLQLNGQNLHGIPSQVAPKSAQDVNIVMQSVWLFGYKRWGRKIMPMALS
ncbi:MAG: hypothetical protein M5U34_36640 [Chloroflexi bacterium]|nr:hypothetical protein [Chloroflexota bacterium]